LNPGKSNPILLTPPNGVNGGRLRRRSIRHLFHSLVQQRAVRSHCPARPDPNHRGPGSEWSLSRGSAEIYDPATGASNGRWPITHGGEPTATWLRDGRVLVTGGGINCGIQRCLYASCQPRYSESDKPNLRRQAQCLKKKLKLTSPRYAKPKRATGGTGSGALIGTIIATNSADIWDPTAGTFTYEDGPE